MRWEELPMASRARLMAAAVRNGYTDIRSIKEAYANYQDQKQTTGNRYDEGGEFEVVNLLDNVPVEYDTEDTGYTPWFIQNTEHAPDNPMTNQQYYSLMEKVATENNPIWNTYRKEEGLPELTVDEEYTRILNDNSYDYRGYYNDPAVRNSNDNANTHWPDEYKTAYHPTFSTYSLYSGMVDPNYNPTGKNGGLWFGDNYVNYNKNADGGNLFGKGSQMNQAKQQSVGGLRGFFNLLDKYKIPYITTSEFRPGAVTKSGNASRHSRKDKWGYSMAVDAVPKNGNFENFMQTIYSYPEIVDYMRTHKIGALEEFTPEVKRKTGARGKNGGNHVHFSSGDGADNGESWAIQMRDNRLKHLNLDTYHPMQDVTWADVQARKQQFELTPEEETLLNTSALATYNPEYNDHNYRSALADAVALDESLDTPLDAPVNNWEKWNAFLNMQSSQSDPLSQMTTMASLSPNTTPQQKEAANWLFNMTGNGGQLYHGLNFAAYGGKVNKFDGITGNSTLENKGINDTDLITKYGFRYVPISSIYDLLNDDELNYNMNNEGMTLKEYYNKYPTAQIAVNNNGRIVTANDLKDLEQKSTLSNTADFSPENWLSLRVERPDGIKYDQSDIDSLNSHQNEYRNIEIAAKQNGSWLKMPDGSTWGGDPRIWVMMQSNAFRNNYIQKPWYTGQAEWNTTYDTPYGVATDKVTRAPFFSGQMWFSNSNLYGNTFANYISENGQNWRAHNPKEWNVNGKNFIAAIPKVGNYRYLNGPTNGTHDHWVYMPYKLENNSIIRLNNDELTTKSVFKGTPNTNTRKDNQKILTDTIANWSRDLGDSGLFMNNINDGPVVKEVEGRTKYIPTIINEFISQPGFTDKVKFILGNNGDFNINDPYKYRALGGPLVRTANNLFNDGGFSDLPEQRAYRRAINLKSPYTNYEDAIDMDDSIMLRLKKFFDKGVSNCTLTASQLFNPNNPIGRARTIVNDSINNGFYEIDADHVIPGTMVIASHPNMSDYSPEQNYHTMVVTGFAPNDYEYTFRDGTKYQIKKGEPLVSYSRGKASADNYVHDVPLSVYNANSEGKTYNRYYRPIDENYPQVMIPEITITR